VETGKPKRRFVLGLLICYSIALGIFALIHTRIVKAPNGRMLVWGWEAHAWAVLPKTIRMPEGEIFVKPFTSVSYSDNYLVIVRFAERNIRYSLTIMGNQIDQGLIAVTFDAFGFIAGAATPLSFKIDNFTFQVSEYGHQEYFDDKNNNHKWDDDEELFYEWTVFISDFDEIRLSDGTVIKNAWPGSDIILMIKKEHTRLYFTGSYPYFVVSNPAWDNEKYIGSLYFEPNWGKVISYREVKDPELR
jgi:hypothetical protein